jgi:aminoglycoside/choline kinase family phosphotransferase
MQRQTELKNWLETIYPDETFELAFAAADADFRRYFRARFADKNVICMDAPPEKMSIAPYLKVQKLFAMVNVPQVYAYNETAGFMALQDLGNAPYLAALTHDTRPEVQKMLLLDAIDTLVELQKGSQPGTLPEYDHATMLREINLFPEWFVAKELGKELNFKQRQLWQQTVDTLLPPLLAQPQVYVHRDFIVRNLMLTLERPVCLIFKMRFMAPFRMIWCRCFVMRLSNGKKNLCSTLSSATGKKPAPPACPCLPISMNSTAGLNGWACSAT